jgi:cytochrome P450
MAKTPDPSTPAHARKPIPADQCPHLGREYNHFEGPHLQNPYPFFRRLREEAPITFNPMLGSWLISRYEDIITVMDNPAVFSSVGSIEEVHNLSPEAQAILGPGPLVIGTPINADPPFHTRLRRFLQPALHPTRISRQETRVRQLANALIDGFVHKGQADLVDEFALPLPLQGLLSLMGIPLSDMANIKQWTLDLLMLSFAKVPPEAQPTMARGVVALREYCTRLVEQRRQQPLDDVVSELAQFKVDGAPITVEEFISLIVALIAGGHEGTTAQITLIVKNLLTQPERWQMLLDDRTLIPKAVDEGMRLEAAAACMTRTTTQEAEVGGVLLPKGARLVVLLSSGNHDEAQFKGADQFDIKRENQRHLGFGRGIHFCAGSVFAKLELRISLELLLERLPRMRLVPGQDYGYNQPLVSMRNIRHLRVEWPVS